MSKDAYSSEFVRRTAQLEEVIGYKFKNKSSLYEALTHSSYSNEKRSQKVNIPCNERLEFLGDSVLSLVVSRYIFTSLSSLPEGELTKLRAFAVCEDALYDFAKSINLGSYLLLGNGEEKTDGRNRKSILADAVEALFAAVFIDSDFDIAAVRPIVMRAALPRIEKMLSTQKKGGVVNYKGTLQQIVQNSKGDRLEYCLAGETGPDHDKIFAVQVKLNSNVIGEGEGRSKQEAEQKAAREALKLFGENV